MLLQVHHLGVEVHCRGCLERVVDDVDVAVGRVDAHHLALEPQRAVDPAVFADLKSRLAAWEAEMAKERTAFLVK